jgi:cytochrome c
MRLPTALACLLLSLPAAPALAQSAPAGDAAAGETLFRQQCRACHQIGDAARNGVGPQLNGVFGRRAGTIEGFRYSNAYRQPPTSEKTWDEANFRVYIRNPREVTPGTNMAYAGLRNEDQITNLIAYLRQFNAQGQRQQ